MHERQYKIEMAMVDALRTLGDEFDGVCDKQELYLRRWKMDGPEVDEQGGICGQAYNVVQIELCRRAPDVYYDIIHRELDS